jgi:hypothetical protein
VDVLKFFGTRFAHPPSPAVSLFRLLIHALGIDAAYN